MFIRVMGLGFPVSVFKTNFCFIVFLDHSGIYGLYFFLLLFYCVNPYYIGIHS